MRMQKKKKIQLCAQKGIPKFFQRNSEYFVSCEKTIIWLEIF